MHRCGVTDIPICGYRQNIFLHVMLILQLFSLPFLINFVQRLKFLSEMYNFILKSNISEIRRPFFITYLKGWRGALSRTCIFKDIYVLSFY